MKKSNDTFNMVKLQDFTYDEIFVGLTKNFSVVVTEEMQSMFLNLCGDINPLHNDNLYAKSKGFNGKVVYGMLISSFYSTLVGTHLPGKNCLFQEAEIKFHNPVLINDILDITGECIKKNDTVKQIIIKARIRNQNKKLVSSAKLKVGILDE